MLERRTHLGSSCRLRHVQVFPNVRIPRDNHQTRSRKLAEHPNAVICTRSVASLSMLAKASHSCLPRSCTTMVSRRRRGLRGPLRRCALPRLPWPAVADGCSPWTTRRRRPLSHRLAPTPQGDQGWNPEDGQRGRLAGAVSADDQRDQFRPLLYRPFLPYWPQRTLMRPSLPSRALRK